MKRSYSTTDLAKMWNVSGSTIKRWADAGLLKCHKTVGGHRKFDIDEVSRFQNRSGLIASQQSVLEEDAGVSAELEGMLAGPDFS
ncbi:MAG TPA: helix-turn-helix domain-containing protein, partial [Blastocatellia bacterium]|nr:helix-turn-helix domain-containing protein [Blastocatellia bacterium]